MLHAGFIAYYEALSDDDRVSHNHSTAPEQYSHLFLTIANTAQTLVQEAIGRIVTHRDAPAYVRELWLSILEFTQKTSVGKLPVSILEMARKSLSQERRRLSDRADPIIVWYAEIDAAEAMNESAFTTLVEANLRVGRQEDAAWSSMQLAESQGVWMQSAWFESLQRWPDAIEANRREGLNNFESLDTLITARHALTEFPEVLKIADENYVGLPHHQKAQLSPLITLAAWAEGDFEAMGRYLSSQPKGSTKLLYK